MRRDFSKASCVRRRRRRRAQNSRAQKRAPSFTQLSSTERRAFIYYTHIGNAARSTNFWLVVTNLRVCQKCARKRGVTRLRARPELEALQAARQRRRRARRPKHQTSRGTRAIWAREASATLPPPAQHPLHNTSASSHSLSCVLSRAPLPHLDAPPRTRIASSPRPATYVLRPAAASGRASPRHLVVAELRSRCWVPVLGKKEQRCVEPIMRRALNGVGFAIACWVRDCGRLGAGRLHCTH